MNKNKSNSDSPRIKSRRDKKKDLINITWRLKSIDEEFTIEAKPEAWIKLKEKCSGSFGSSYITQGLYRDLRPFIQRGWFDCT